MTLQDTVAVVTGASQGIGLALAQQLVSAGATVAGVARSADDLAAVADVLGDRFRPTPADVSDADAIGAAIDGVADDLGRLDILVNNAGLGRFGPVDALDLEAWRGQIDVNLSGAFYATRAAVPHLKAGGGGHIVHVGSIAGIIGNAELSAYNASKFGLRGFAEATMKELRPHGIKTTYLAPGSVDTDFGAKAGQDDTNPHAMSPESVAATIVHVLTAPDGTLISEVVLRPMGTRG